MNTTKQEQMIAARIGQHAKISEKNIEAYLQQMSQRLGVTTIKMDGRMQTGLPDRCVLLPGGRCAWIEVKSRGKRPRRIQLWRMETLRQHGHVCYVVDSHAGVDKLFEDLYNLGWLP